MADRTSYPCPKCGSLIDYYNESWPEQCSECGKWFKVTHELREIENIETYRKAHKDDDYS